MALIDHFGVECAVNLTPDRWEGFEDRVVKRARDAFERGLYEETERAIAAGYGNTFPMTSMLYRPAMRVIAGEICETEALDAIRDNALDNVLEHDMWYRDTPGLLRLKHSPDRVDKTATTILTALYDQAV